MLHEKSSASAGLFSCSKLFSPPALRAAPEGATGGDPQTPALSVFPLLSVHALLGSRCFPPLVPDPAGGAGDAAEGGIPDWGRPPDPRPFRFPLAFSACPRWFLPNPKIAEQVDVPPRPLGGAIRCSASPNCRAEHQDVPLGGLECGW